MDLNPIEDISIIKVGDILSFEFFSFSSEEIIEGYMRILHIGILSYNDYSTRIFDFKFVSKDLKCVKIDYIGENELSTYINSNVVFLAKCSDDELAKILLIGG